MSRDLSEYQSKRMLAQTPEPGSGGRRKGGALLFVVQKHSARALHYDFRLEMEGALKSWAVPKGPSLDPSKKRLAVKVEDHPVEYADFEGVIPEGNYGAGAVIVWDRGSYSHPDAANEKENERLALEGLKKGDLKFVLHGKKLNGEFALVKTRMNPKSWLLIKKRDGYATPADVLEKNRSAVSGKTVEEVSGAAPDEALPGRKKERIRFREAEHEAFLKDAPRRPMPHGIKPMLASLVKKPFDDPDWIFEVKWDGYRALAEIGGGKVSLRSRGGNPMNRKFGPIAEYLKKLEFEAVLDGEIVVVDDRGRPDFQELQNYPRIAGLHLLYYVFDVLHFQGRDLTALPLIERKELLEKILPSAGPVRFNGHVKEKGVLFFEAAREKGLEGIVAKHSRSDYKPGTRSRRWLKIKSRLTQEAVICGFTAPEGSREYFGSLILGVYESEILKYIGNAGSGFDGRALKELMKKMKPLIRKRSPLGDPPKIRDATWLKPELVCEVEFHGWTAAGVMRQAVFMRMRADKEPREVERESSL